MKIGNTIKKRNEKKNGRKNKEKNWTKILKKKANDN